MNVRLEILDQTMSTGKLFIDDKDVSHIVSGTKIVADVGEPVRAELQMVPSGVIYSGGVEHLQYHGHKGERLIPAKGAIVEGDTVLITREGQSMGVFYVVKKVIESADDVKCVQIQAVPGA